MDKTVLILDAGSQYGKLIDRCVRNLGIHTDIHPMETDALDFSEYGAIIISGGPQSVAVSGASLPHPSVWTCEIPILGICYGMQVICHHFGAEFGSVQQDGQTDITITKKDNPIIHDSRVLLTHQDAVIQVSPPLEITAIHDGVIVGIQDTKSRIFGVQFHPEVNLTPRGSEMLKHFLVDISGIPVTLGPDDLESRCLDCLNKVDPSDHIVVLASGGVDSTVCAALMLKHHPVSNVHVIHVDTGFMREGESQQVASALTQLSPDIQFHLLHAHQEFAEATTTLENGKTVGPLSKIWEPEHKRKIIGDTFIRLTRGFISGLHGRVFLVQGTLRPDLIESASLTASAMANVIKTHHNDTRLVREMREQGLVIEPLADLHKDQVRSLGLKLGLPDSLVWRQPFPGPGLAIRIRCNPMDGWSLLPRIGTTQAWRLPIQSVGVQGDQRTFRSVIALNLSIPLDWSPVYEWSRNILRSESDCNRVIFHIAGPWTGGCFRSTTYLETRHIECLRRADAIVSRKMGDARLFSQVPVVMMPISFSKRDCRSIVIRPFQSLDFMTGRAMVPGVDMELDLISDLAREILDTLPDITNVFLDLTGKPPGTTEWE